MLSNSTSLIQLSGGMREERISFPVTSVTKSAFNDKAAARPSVTMRVAFTNGPCMFDVDHVGPIGMFAQVSRAAKPCYLLSKSQAAERSGLNYA